MVISGEKHHAQDYIEGLNILASMRLCANVPGQHAIQTALGGYQSIDDSWRRAGACARQRDLAYDLVTSIPGVTCVKPKAALYIFRASTPRSIRSLTTRSSSSSCSSREAVLVVQGTGFNWPRPITSASCSCPNTDDLRTRGAPRRFLDGYRRRKRQS